MQRQIIKQLIDWKNKPNRKPLIIQGARQVGKTWAMKHFGEREFKQVAYINFDNNSRMKALFEADFDLERILLGLSIETGIDLSPHNVNDTLLIFDEIQEVPSALTALKYFYENAPDYAIVSAGSLLGIALHQGLSFPVGKVDFMSLYPMSFHEFLRAVGDAKLVDLLALQDWTLITAMKSKYIDRLKQYYFVGGMPEAVQAFVNTTNFETVRAVQNNLLMAYEQDFSKHIDSATLVARVRALWHIIPAELAKENKKFKVSSLKKGARFKDVELALQWLSDCGLVCPVYRINKPNLPLSVYRDNIFKLFYLDVGLLGAKSQLNAKTLLEGNRLFTEFKGALTEQYVYQQLQVNQFKPFYWAKDNSTAEVDFLIQYEQAIYPIEVKAEENLRAKSLKLYNDTFTPPISLRFSMADYRVQDWLVNVPLYAVENITDVLQQN